MPTSDVYSYGGALRCVEEDDDNTEVAEVGRGANEEVAAAANIGASATSARPVRAATRSRIKKKFASRGVATK